MKLKLAKRVLSRAKHLLRFQAQDLEAVGSLIRHSSVRAAMRCAKLGRNTDLQFHKSLKEFLAFFCVIAVNELALKGPCETEEDLLGLYQKILEATCQGKESNPEQLDQQLVISRVISYKKSGFDHWFYGYWNADFDGMRISKQDLEQLGNRHVPGPSGSYSADAGLILLLRVARLENAQNTIPAAAVLRDYDSAIRMEVSTFVRKLKETLQ